MHDLNWAVQISLVITLLIMYKSLIDYAVYFS